MSFKHCSPARLFVAAVALGSCGLLHAQSLTPASATPDQSLQTLKQAVAEFDRDAKVFERDTLYPAHSRVALYLGVRINNLLIRDIRVSIDNGQMQQMRYSEAQARALFAGSNIARLLYANATPGPHRLRVDYVAQYDRSSPDAPPITGTYFALFDKNNEPAELELVFSPGRSKSRPALALKQWRRQR